MKFHENPSHGSWTAPCGRTDGLTDRQDMKLIVAFRNFANAPKNHTSNSHCTYTGKLQSYFSARHVVVWGNRGLDPLVLTLGARWIWVVNFTPMPLYCRGRCLQNTREGGGVAPYRRSGHFGQKKSLSSVVRNRTAISRSSSLVTLLIKLARRCYLRQPVLALQTYGISP
jgi:hypothetical protein